jgi:hypothetical protein
MTVQMFEVQMLKWILRRTVEQLGIDDFANTYLPPQADVAKRVRRTRNIGAALGESSIMTKRS